MVWLFIAVVVAIIFYLANKKPAKPKYTPNNFKLDPVSPSSPRSVGNRTPARWVPAGEMVEVQGISFDAGMVYIGGKLPGQGRYDVVNCLIDPTLALNNAVKIPDMPYWPAYASITPAARRAYLKWLEGGRRDPEANIGYSFLFFYGLERRLFVDKALTEADAIISEVKRLRTVYPNNNSFRNYTDTFLEAAHVFLGKDSTAPDLKSYNHLTNGLSFQFRSYLGKMLANNEPLAAQDALVWVMGTPDGYPRTPVTRCWDEFKQLWEKRFTEKYPKGMKVNAPKTKLEMQYTACSGNFKVDLTPVQLTPDIAALTAPLKPLREMFRTCTEELEPYSRLIGRKPATKGKLESLILLPKIIQGSIENSPLKEISSYLELKFDGKDTLITSAEKMLQQFGMADDKGKTVAAMLAQIAPAFDAMKIGFEPDKRYGSASFPKDGTIVLFRLNDDQAVDPDKSEYQIAKTMIEVTALAAAADGGVNETELETMRCDVNSMTDLTATEKQRLAAYAKLLAVDTPRQAGVMNKLSKLAASERIRVANSAIASVLADGHADPAELKFLEKLYRALDLDADELYSAVHRGAIIVDDSVTIIPAESVSGVPIPKRPIPTSPTGQGISIDLARLERIKNETSAVSNLLANIFVEDPATVPQTTVVTESSAFEGLDSAHAMLLNMFLSKPEYERSEFEERARGLQLMPDGAIETINDWAFDTFEEALLDGDETIVISNHLVIKLKEMAVRT